MADQVQDLAFAHPAGPARNRVTPWGDITAAPGRGDWMGNRGRLHEGTDTRDIVRDYQTKAWLTCALSFRGRRLSQWQAGRYTLLFFLDEAVALAAGHRPCALCRRDAFVAFADAVADGGPRLRAGELDARLHAERAPGGAGRRPLTGLPWATLPEGAFVVTDDGAAVVADDHLAFYDRTANAYGRHAPLPRAGRAAVLSPPTVIGALQAGYRPHIADAAR
jgi:hypothetical protein